MKKLFVFFAVFASLLIGVKGVNAMTEDELKAIMTKTYTINGGKFKLEDYTKGYLEQYLNAYDVSSADAQYIADRVNEAVDIIKASGKSSTKDLSAATKTQLKGLVEKVSANTSVKATVQGNNVVVYKPDGGVFASIDKPIKQTGSESSIVALIASVSFLITVAGACLVVKQVKTSK